VYDPDLTASSAYILRIKIQMFDAKKKFNLKTIYQDWLSRHARYIGMLDPKE
jgi:hypothetical protein